MNEIIKWKKKNLKLLKTKKNELKKIINKRRNFKKIIGNIISKILKEYFAKVCSKTNLTDKLLNSLLIENIILYIIFICLQYKNKK